MEVQYYKSTWHGSQCEERQKLLDVFFCLCMRLSAALQREKSLCHIACDEKGVFVLLEERKRKKEKKGDDVSKVIQ